LTAAAAAIHKHPMPLARAALATLAVLAARAAAGADEPQPWNLAFVGGGVIPEGDMSAHAAPGLDVGARFGWSTPSGLGLQLGLAFAPLRPRNLSDTSDQLFAGALGPRFTLGHDVVRLWVAGAGGLVVERTNAVSSTVTFAGLGGLDLHIFGNGGFTVAGEYTRALTSATVEFVAVTGGLMFTM
jgi:hypothetical protein